MESTPVSPSSFSEDPRLSGSLVRAPQSQQELENTHWFTAIQTAKLSGFFPIITTVSPRNNDLVKSLGATHSVDRSLSGDEIVAAVKKITSEPVKIVYDAISEASTEIPAYEIVAPGGTLVLVLPTLIPKEKITPDKDIINTFGTVHAEDNREFGREMYSKITSLFESGDLKVRISVRCLNCSSD